MSASTTTNGDDIMNVLGRARLIAAVRGHYRKVGLSGPTLADVNHVLDALRDAGLLASSANPQGAVDAIVAAYEALGKDTPVSIDAAYDGLEAWLKAHHPAYGGQ